MKASAYSPSQITGIFEIWDSSQDPLRIGSRGAGLCLEKGVVTEVFVEKGGTGLQVTINGKPSFAPVSRAVLSEYARLGFMKEPMRFLVKHFSWVPVGGGFGASGAGALSLSLAVNEALSLGLSYNEASQIAHRAEVLCKTGLGSVLAETAGGFGLRTLPGAPGIGKLENFGNPKGHALVAVFLKGMTTKDYLSNPRVKGMVNMISRDGMDRIISTPSHETFMRESLRFSRSLGLLTPHMAAIMDEALLRGFACSMAMFGETVFTVIHESEVNDVLKIFSQSLGHAGRDGRIVVSRVAERGAHAL